MAFTRTCAIAAALLLLGAAPAPDYDVLIRGGTIYDGAGGALDFDENGDVDGIIVQLAVEGGKFVEKGTIE